MFPHYEPMEVYIGSTAVRQRADEYQAFWGCGRAAAVEAAYDTFLMAQGQWERTGEVCLPETGGGDAVAVCVPNVVLS